MIYPFIWGQAYTPFKCGPDHHNMPRRSIAFFCPQCGEIWARLVSTEDTKWGPVVHRSCDKCGPLNPPYDFERAGSLTFSYDADLYNALPVDLLRREVLLLKESSCT